MACGCKKNKPVVENTSKTESTIKQINKLIKIGEEKIKK